MENADAGPLLHLPYLFTSLVRLAPINHLLRRLPAANAFIGQVLLLKGYASGCGSGHLLDFLLTLQAAAPHGFYQSPGLLLTVSTIPSQPAAV